MKLRSGRKRSSNNVSNGECSSSLPSINENEILRNAASRRTWRTVSSAALPVFLQDNEFLLRGHRPLLGSYAECFKSILHIHTETGNIWTHLIGCLAFVVITAVFITKPPDEVSLAEKVTFSVFFVGAITCMGLSTLFHTLYCHSERVGNIFSRLDYVGIIILIVTSFTPWLYYGFYCDSAVTRITYMVSEIGIGMLCVIAVLDSRFRTPKLRPIRALLFVGLGLTGVVPGIHFLVHNGFWPGFRFLVWLLVMAGSYIVGAVIYALRVPERFSPGTFDIWGQSHQIMHLCVVAGALFCYHGASDLARTRLSSPEPCVLSA